MKKFKHKKIRNTGILFELLARQLASDVMRGSKPTSLQILQKFFKENSELGKELALYQTLLSEKYKDRRYALELVREVLIARKALNEESLKRAKYRLIKDIKEQFNVADFFKTRVTNYPVYASIYNLFENSSKSEHQNLVPPRLRAVRIPP